MQCDEVMLNVMRSIAKRNMEAKSKEGFYSLGIAKNDFRGLLYFYS